MKVLIFNICELIVVILFGVLLKIDKITIVILLLTWTITRAMVPKPMHYKSPFRCFLMTILMFISLFLATKVHVVIGVLCVIFDNIILSKHGNLKDSITNLNTNMFQWNNFGDKRKSQYQKLIDYVVKNPDCSILVEHENYWKNNYPNRYDIFVLFFRKRMTYDSIIHHLNLKDNTLIKKECKIIYSVLEIPLDLEKTHSH